MVSFNKRKKEKNAAPKAERPEAGLDALLIDQGAEAAPVVAVPEEDILVKGPPSMFYAVEQVRTHFDEHAIAELAASMRETGQIQAIVVYPADVDGPNKGKHRIDKGERRWRAAQLIEGFELRAQIDFEAPKRTEAERIQSQVAENDQQEKLKPMDMARSVMRLVEEGRNLEQIALKQGWLTKTTKKPNVNKVSRILSIMKMPEEGQKLAEDLIVEDLITLEFLRKIADINPNKFSLLCDLAREDGGITRKRAEQEYKQCLANDPSVQSGQRSNAAEEEDNAGAAQNTTKVEPKVENSGSDPVATDRNSPNSGSEGGSPSQQEEVSSGRQQPSQNGSSNTKPVKSTETQKPESKPEQPITQKHYPTIRVMWRNRKYGTLLFDKQPEEKGFFWITTEDGDVISTELDDLKIVDISH